MEAGGRACVFCRITARQGPASIVYEDDATLAFLDIRQLHPGHTLVVPKQHFETVFDLDHAAAAAIMSATVRVARAVRHAFAPDGINLWQSNGVAAGQEVPHFHMHVMPRYLGDGILRVYPGRVDITPRAELEACAARIRAALQ